jgi:hypothetical protein
MSIEFNYVFMQNGTMFYLLDLIDYSWTMSLNFEKMIIPEPWV